MTQRLTTILFAATLFLSAALMFTVQPMAGKMLTPLFGGAPSTWLSAMAYFQISLLIGYTLAFLFSRFAVRVHISIIILMLLSGLAFLPLRITEPQTALFADLSEAFRVVLILIISMTLPFVALSTLSPSLQRLFAGSKRDPYFLFAASNLGSFGGLLAYPLLMEKFSGLGVQTEIWKVGYGALIALCVVCLFVARKFYKTPPRKTQERFSTLPQGEGGDKCKASCIKTSWKQKGTWLVLSFVPSSLMMGVTAHVTADMGAVPFFWILPLGLYLLTFVLAFAKDDDEKSFDHLAFIQAFAVALLFLPFINVSADVVMVGKIVMSLIVFYATARYFHGMLAASRPDATYLTQFYLWVALGGALGGSFNAFVAPVLFSTPIEFLFLVLFSLFIPIPFRIKQKLMPDRFALGGLITAFVLAGVLRVMPDSGLFSQIVEQVFISMLLFSFFFISFRPWLSSVGVLGVLLILFAGQTASETLAVKRNFFGVLYVKEEIKDGTTIRKLVHGTTVHGMQQVAPQIVTTPNSYYLPVGAILSAAKAKNVGMIGLGAGTVVCHAASERRFTVYEIDADVVALAHQYFDFMKVCGRPEIKIGDGRKLLEEDSDRRFDALVIDAFSSDSIPVHLLTREAVQMYFDRLSPQGLAAFHISNRYFNLVPQLSAMAQSLGLVGVTIFDKPDEKVSPLATQSKWVVLARNSKDLSVLKEKGWKDIPSSQERVWTDDYSNMLSALTFLNQGNE